MGWRQTTSSDNFKQYMVNDNTTLEDGTVLETSDILILIPSESGDMFYKRNDHNAEIEPNGFQISDISILSEISGHITLFSKEINGEEYRFLRGDFIHIFKPNQVLQHDDRESLMNILETIIKSYHQDIENGNFRLKPESERNLQQMNPEEQGNYEDLIRRLGENLDYIHMAIGLRKISEEIYHRFIQAQAHDQASMKSKRKKRRKSKRKKSSKKKKSKKPKKSSKKKKKKKSKK